MTVLIHSKQAQGLTARQGFNVGRCHQNILGSIGHDLPRLGHHQHMIKGLVSADMTRLLTRPGIAGIHVHNQTLKGIIAMPDDLTKAEAGCVFRVLHSGVTPIPTSRCTAFTSIFKLVSLLCCTGQFNLTGTGATFGRPF